MSTVPPNLVGPILQSHLAQRQISSIRDTERSQEVVARRQQSHAIDEKDSTVETTDNDTQVHTDSEGSGSQGRAFSQAEEPQEGPADSESATGELAGQHIDIEA